MIIIVFVALCVIMRMKLKEELSSSELEKQKADIDKFFTAFLKYGINIVSLIYIYSIEKKKKIWKWKRTKLFIKLKSKAMSLH